MLLICPLYLSTLGREVQALHNDGTLFNVQLCLLEVVNKLGGTSFAGKVKLIKASEANSSGKLTFTTDRRGIMDFVSDEFKDYLVRQVVCVYVHIVLIVLLQF